MHNNYTKSQVKLFMLLQHLQKPRVLLRVHLPQDIATMEKLDSVKSKRKRSCGLLLCWMAKLLSRELFVGLDDEKEMVHQRVLKALKKARFKPLKIISFINLLR